MVPSKAGRGGGGGEGFEIPLSNLAILQDIFLKY